MNDKFRLLAIGLACVCSSFPQVSMAEDVFKSSDFLTWERKGQEFYIRTSIGMASLVVARTSKQDSHCIDSWYTSDTEAAHQYILKQMQRFPSYHPCGVILAVLEKKCGDLIYNE